MQPHHFVQPKRPCKFGNNCNKYKTGQCTFLHDNSQFGGGGGNMGGGIGGGGIGGNMGPGMGGKGGGGMGGGKGGHGGHGGKGGGGKFLPQQDPTISIPMNENQLMQKFCRYYHFDSCKNPNGCKRIHGFTESQDLGRTYFNK